MPMGAFQVSILRNIVHPLFGVVGITMAKSQGGARNYLLWDSVVHLVPWIYGLVIDHDSDANLVPVTNAGNWLHLARGIGMVALALPLTRGTRKTPRTTTTR